MNDEKKQEIVLTKTKLAVILTVMTALIAGAVLVGLHWNNWFGERRDTAVASPDIDPNARDYTGQAPSNGGGESTGIKIPGYPSITIAANTKDVTMALLNPEGNPCYFAFEIILDGSGEMIYQSKQVPPGKSISKVTLNRALPAGEYHATIRIATASLTDLSAMNGANVKTVLIAK